MENLDENDIQIKININADLCIIYYFMLIQKKELIGNFIFYKKLIFGINC